MTRRVPIDVSVWEVGCVQTLLRWVSVKYSNRHLFALWNITPLTFHHCYNTGRSRERDVTASIQQEYMYVKQSGDEILQGHPKKIQIKWWIGLEFIWVCSWNRLRWEKGALLSVEFIPACVFLIFEIFSSSGKQCKCNSFTIP